MEKIKNGNQPIGIFKGLIWAVLFTIIALSLFSILLVNTNLSEQTIEPVILVVTGVAIIFGSSMGTKGIKTKGVVKGGLIGTLYIFSLYLLSSIAKNDFSLNGGAIIMFFIGILGGTIGGVIGMNVCNK